MKQQSPQRNLDKELAKARMIQQLLLPQSFPIVVGAHLAYRYVPVYDLAGDFLDYFYKRATGELGFVICDVSGHGIPAALISAMLKMSLQMWGEYLDDPQGTLLKMRRLLMGKLGDDFVTASMGYIELETGRLRCVNAGHTPLIRLRHSGETQHIKPDGCIIHEQVEQRLEVFEGVLDVGDRLVLYTDGLSEAKDSVGSELGDEGLLAALQANGGYPPDEMCERTLRSVVDFVGGRSNLLDDCTLFVIEYTGTPDALPG